MEKFDTKTTTGETMKIQMGRRQGKAIALGLLILALVVGACGGGGDDEQTPQAADKADTTETADACLLYTSPSPRDGLLSRMPSSA